MGNSQRLLQLKPCFFENGHGAGVEEEGIQKSGRWENETSPILAAHEITQVTIQLTVTYFERTYLKTKLWNVHYWTSSPKSCTIIVHWHCNTIAVFVLDKVKPNPVYIVCSGFGKTGWEIFTWNHSNGSITCYKSDKSYFRGKYNVIVSPIKYNKTNMHHYPSFIR